MARQIRDRTNEMANVQIEKSLCIITLGPLKQLLNH